MAIQSDWQNSSITIMGRSYTVCKGQQLRPVRGAPGVAQVSLSGKEKLRKSSSAAGRDA